MSDVLDKVVHNLTHRRFKTGITQSPYELGTAVSNSFFDPRNIGNFEAGEIAPEGMYATHYPVNVGSNTAGFSIIDDMGQDRGEFNHSIVSANVNALEKRKMSGGSGSSSGSASDYIYFNPYYEALLNPKSQTRMEEIAQPHYIPINTLSEKAIKGRGTNAPSGASAIDYAMNNPYAFPSNFSKGLGLGASSSGSASDYYDSNPNRVPEMQSETRHYTDFMMEGGAIDWSQYLGYIRKGAEVLPKIIKEAPVIYQGAKSALEAVRDIRETGDLRKASKQREKVYKGVKSTIDTIKELRTVLKSGEKEEKQTKMKEMTQQKKGRQTTRQKGKKRASRK
jgi:hypothetical protein